MYQLRLTLIALLLLFNLISFSQSFTGATGPIPDNGPLTAFPFVVSGLPVTSLDTTYGIETVCITISHTYVSDLQIKLQSPDGTIINLSLANGGSGNNYNNTCFDDNAANIISSGNAPFSGSFRPQWPLYTLNNGQNPNGIWNLLIQDTYTTDPGSLISSFITFGNNPGIPFPFTSSNLPIVKINTLNQTIIDEPKIQCRMQIIDNGTGNRNYLSDTVYTYDSWIGIEYRGSSSQGFPKKSFGVETRDSLQNDSAVSILNMPKESDWVFNANYTDKSFMRNTLAYDLFSKMGRYSSRTRYTELFIDNVYQGIYVICEKIKRDSNRVDIANLTVNDNVWPDVSGGYILKVDKPTGNSGAGFQSLFPPTNGGTIPTILYDYPSSADITTQQSAYIVAYMDSFETALQGPNYVDPLIGYRKYVDTPSFIDFLLLNEVTKCVDSYRISAYLYKEKSVAGGKLYAGPVWDFDIAWGNANYFNGQFTAGWSYTLNAGSDPYQVPFWWQRFMQDPNFKNELKCRWTALRNGPFATANVMAWIDSVALVLNESQQRNFTLWPILGVYVWPNPTPLPQTYAAEVAQFKNWVSLRLAYMDLSLPGTCTTSGIESVSSNDFLIWPNPATQQVSIAAANHTIGEVTLYDLSGREIIKYANQNSPIAELSLVNIDPGVYMLKAMIDGQALSKKIVVQ